MKCIKEDWEKELGMDIAEEIWEKSLKYVNICSLLCQALFNPV